jgi:predicted esterase
LRITPILSISLTTLLLPLLAFAPPSGRPVVSSNKPATMQVCCQIWHDLPGAQITDTLATTDLQRPPSEVRQLDPMEFVPNFKDQWACSMSALLTVPVTGRYRFNIAARDSGILFLSTDDSPAHRRYIAEVPAATNLHDYRWYSSQLSEPIDLEKGQRYFIQAIGKSGPGPGAISVGWTLPNGTFQGPIPFQRFVSYSGSLSVPDMRVHQLVMTLKPDVPPTTQPGVHRFIRGVHVDVDGNSQDMSYLLYMPRALVTTNDPLPMLIFLHGNSRQGYSLTAVEQLGPMRSIESDKKLGEWMPMVVMVPQLPPEWRWDTPGAAQSVNALVEKLCQRFPRIDRNRIYLTGLSMGGKGTWLTLEASPQIYAAAAPFSAVDVRPDLAPQLLKNIRYLHIVCGGNDNGFTTGSHRMYEALKPTLGDRVQFTEYPGEGHNVWDHYYPFQSFYETLLKFSK